MKALIFSHSSRLGGAERSLLELVKHLVSDYQTRCTVILQPDGLSIKHLEDVGAEIITAPIYWWCAGPDQPDIETIRKDMSYSLEWLLENLDQIKSLQPDVILTNTITIPWGAICAQLIQRPHIWMINEFGVLDHGLRFIYPFDQILSIIQSAADRIVTRSHAVQNTLFPNLPQDKVETVYPAIEPPDSKIKTNYLHSTYYHQPASFRLLMTSTLMAAKGQEDAVLSVIELVKNRNRKVELVLAGYAQPDYQAYLQELIRNGGIENLVHIIPFQENVFSVVQEADAVLMCSKMEAFGRVTVESMLMEKAVIATHTGGSIEIIQDGVTGLLYTPGNHQELADKIESLIMNPTLRKEISRNGYDFAKSTFVPENFAGKYHTIFQQLTQQPFHPKQDTLWLLTAQFQNLIDQKNLHIQALDDQISDLKGEILTYTQSKSWRLTRPFRKIAHLFNKKEHD